MVFSDRLDAGRQLGLRLSSLRGQDNVVLGVTPGGVPVAFEVAHALNAPLDVIVVRELEVPHQPDIVFGAIGEGGVRVIDHAVVTRSGVTAAQMSAVEQQERKTLHSQVDRLREGCPHIRLARRTAVIVVDAIATGAAARAACQIAKVHGARRIVLAVPVGTSAIVAELSGIADDVICLRTPPSLSIVGEWYSQFGRTSDDEVLELLRRAAGAELLRRAAADLAAPPTSST